MSEITVVIPNYNGMKYLPECMTSLCERQENAPEYEVLIIDKLRLVPHEHLRTDGEYPLVLMDGIVQSPQESRFHFGVII